MYKISKNIVALALVLVLILSASTVADGYEPVSDEEVTWVLLDSAIEYLTGMLGYKPRYVEDEGYLVFFMANGDLLRSPYGEDELGNRWVIDPRSIHLSVLEVWSLVGCVEDAIVYDGQRWVDIFWVIDVLNENYLLPVIETDSTTLTIAAYEEKKELCKSPRISYIELDDELYVKEADACQFLYDLWYGSIISVNL